jgi:50S ribosomal protein L16 3-hydroxylase
MVRGVVGRRRHRACLDAAMKPRAICTSDQGPTAMVERLFDDDSLREFITHYFFRRPYSQAGAADWCRELGSWETIARLIENPASDLLIVKEGARWEGTRPTYEAARELHAGGHTVLVRHAERHDARLADVAAVFEQTFEGPVDIQIYCTPANQGGFGWHYDAEDVFILQSEGVKDYSLRKNTVNPWPLIETLPENMQYEREIMPLARCQLQAGDWLYIPNGYWHRARASEPSISLSVGVLTASALEVYRFLEARLVQSLLWRQRLPIAAAMLSRQEFSEGYRELFVHLGNDLLKILKDEKTVQEFLDSRARSQSQ